MKHTRRQLIPGNVRYRAVRGARWEWESNRVAKKVIDPAIIRRHVGYRRQWREGRRRHRLIGRRWRSGLLPSECFWCGSWGWRTERSFGRKGGSGTAGCRCATGRAAATLTAWRRPCRTGGTRVAGTGPRRRTWSEAGGTLCRRPPSRHCLQNPRHRSPKRNRKRYRWKSAATGLASRNTVLRNTVLALEASHFIPINQTTVTECHCS